MKLWFAVPFGAAMLLNPKIAAWFVISCIALSVIFGSLVILKMVRGEA